MSVWDRVRDLVAGGRVSRADAELWYAARTLADLGDLTAQWLEGAIRSEPGYMPNAGPDDETQHLIPILAAANRAGCLTDCSQPGVPPFPGYDGATWCQRAAVSGFASRDLMERIGATCTAGGMLVQTHAPKDHRGRDDGIHVTVRAAVNGGHGEHVTWFGHRLPRKEIEFLYGDLCHPAAVKAIKDAWQVTVIDPQWGRDDTLWPLLTQAITLEG